MFFPPEVMAEKKSYNYMASPNYLQYENTYQKYKNICHHKDVTNFRNNNLHQEQRMIEYTDHTNTVNDRFTGIEIKAENTMQSSDDEGGFKQNIHYTNNQINHLNGGNGYNNINGNMRYNFKEIEPLLNGAQVREAMQMSSNRQKYEPPHYANPGSMIPMQNAPISMDNQMVNHSHSNKNRFNQSQFQHGNSPYRKVPPIPFMQHYTKPLPKLPTNIGDVKFIKIMIHLTSHKN